MGKKVIRLTEADIEKIVRNVLKEQSEQPAAQQSDEIIMNRPDAIGGIFKVQGSKLMWCESKDSGCQQIWEKGANVEWTFNNGVLKPGGWVNVQLSLFGGYDFLARYNGNVFTGTNTPYAPTQRNWQGFNQVNWTQLRGDDEKVYFWALDENTGLPMMDVTVIIAGTRKNIKDPNWVRMVRGGENALTLSRDKIIWGQTTVKYDNKNYFVCAVGFGTPVRPGSNTPTTPTPPPRKPVVDRLEMALMDMFKFDETEFTNSGEAQSKINDFISQLKGYSTKFNTNENNFKQHIINSKPIVFGYASRDQDPAEKITGGFTPCKGEPTRGDYNRCLSQHRADKVAEMINTGLDGTGMNVFTAKGMGETDKFAPGKKWPEVKDNTQTAPNRRVYTFIPPFKYTRKQ